VYKFEQSVLGLVHSRQIFVYFAKNSVISFVKQVRTVIFFPTKFCQASSGAGQIFVRRENWQIFLCARHDLKENFNQVNLVSL